jgi:ATP-dependent exoDNAse (exonuclease V) alpha subunit
VEQVQGLPERVLQDTEVVLLAPDSGRLGADGLIRREDGRVVVLPDEARYSTVDLLAAERRALSLALDGQDAGRALAGPERVERALAERPTLSDEQAEMVRRLTSSGAAVDVVVGKAGPGKTYALDAARDAWQRSGVRVIGCALAARAAQELTDGARIPSTSIDALLTRFDRTGGGLPRGSVLVVDEAGMVGTRKLARLLEHPNRRRARSCWWATTTSCPRSRRAGCFARWRSACRRSS